MRFADGAIEFAEVAIINFFSMTAVFYIYALTVERRLPWVALNAVFLWWCLRSAIDRMAQRYERKVVAREGHRL